MTVILTYIAYSAFAIHATPAFDEMRSVTGASCSFFLVLSPCDAYWGRR